MECKIRSLRLPRFSIEYVPAFQMAGISLPVPQGVFPYRLAIAFVTDNSVGSAPGDRAISLTVSGSNTAMMFNCVSLNDTNTAADFNGSSATFIGKTTYGTGLLGSAGYYLVAPAAGAHNATCSFSAGSNNGAAATQYSGCAQTGFLDSSAVIARTTSTSMAVTTTVVASNCWIVGMYSAGGGECFAPTRGLKKAP